MATNPNILFKRGSQSVLNTLKTNNQGIDGAFYLTEDTHRLYAGIGSKIVDLNQYITVVNARTELGNITNPQVGDFAYIKNENILAVYTNDDPQKPWAQINQNTDTTYTLEITGDDEDTTDPGVLTFKLVDQEDNPASTVAVQFVGTKGIDVTVTSDGEVQIEGNPQTLGASYSAVDTSGHVTYMDITLTSDEDKDENGENGEVDPSKVRLGAGKNIKFLKTADGIDIEGVDAAEFETTGCKFEVDGGTAEVSIELKNGAKVTIPAVNADDQSTKSPFHLNYGKNATETVDNQGDMKVYTMEEVDDLIASANAMTYVGPVPSTGLPTGGENSKVSIGDTYMVASPIEFWLGAGNIAKFVATTDYEKRTAKLGDLFIATSSDKTEVDGVIESSKLVWTYIPAGDDSQTDTTYYCKLNTNTNIFSICDKNDAVIGHIDVDTDSMIVATSTLDKDNYANVATPWNLKLEHAKVTRTDDTAGANGATSVEAISAIETDAYGHITKVTTKTTNLATYAIEGAEVEVSNNSAAFEIYLNDSNDDEANKSTAYLDIAANQNDNLAISKLGDHGISISMVWGSFAD